MANQVCKVCAETFPASATACPRCGFSSHQAASGTVVDEQGFAVDQVPASAMPQQVHAPPGFPPQGPSAPLPVVHAAGSRAPAIIGIVVALVVLGAIGGGIFMATQVFKTVGDVTDSIDRTIEEATRGQGGSGPAVDGSQPALSRNECVRVVGSYASKAVVSFTDADALGAIFVEAGSRLDPAALQVLIDAVSNGEVATAAATGDTRQAERLAAAIVAEGCGVQGRDPKEKGRDNRKK